MGSLYEYACEKCGLTAEVSGGLDRGFSAATATRYCRTCGELRDVLVGNYDHSAGVPPQSTEDYIGRCPRCKGQDLAPWHNGDPCPRCGGKVRQMGLTACWD